MQLSEDKSALCKYTNTVNSMLHIANNKKTPFSLSPPPRPLCTAAPLCVCQRQHTHLHGLAAFLRSLLVISHKKKPLARPHCRRPSVVMSCVCFGAARPPKVMITNNKCPHVELLLLLAGLGARSSISKGRERELSLLAEQRVITNPKCNKGETTSSFAISSTHYTLRIYCTYCVVSSYCQNRASVCVCVC